MDASTHRSARGDAQELVWSAMELIHSDPDRAAALCQQALKLHQHSADALTMLADLDDLSGSPLIEALRNAVEAGRTDLGKRFFREEKGLFWGLIETRPFMRAMAMLADALLESGTPVHVDEAISIHEEMLELNPDDNQGVRDWLAASYLARKRYADATALFARYPEDWLATPAWSRVLHAYATGDKARAPKLLKEARTRNRYVTQYLSGAKRRPRRRAASYSPGDESEAVYCADILWAVWKAHSRARMCSMIRRMVHEEPPVNQSAKRVEPPSGSGSAFRRVARGDAPGHDPTVNGPSVEVARRRGPGGHAPGDSAPHTRGLRGTDAALQGRSSGRGTPT